ncbi:DUF6243 family protein [Streptomyces albireticuli]|uniref:Uncharacterized protein n=1 Tax=Streptomyces albireticuli TaxID=1940 RepID=A0A2A2D826_9ACTN|nr:DUF6243 family protein [Streptomyces albireticuli]MCD9140529.1 DUF6243 family protein [Streptomyces albireticuli]MCD9161509.1 DUF6243 family protein [Streptomyces albireticuli]MCD9192921.1 DUF6243 family protein [Streptomyces albireticuli]PAU47490.1 hypothetical protein CK936_18440 [Streptomyces albireticuli]
MGKGSGNMLGVGGTRANLSRSAMRGGKKGGAPKSGLDPMEQKRELLRKLKEARSTDESPAS